MDGLLRDAREEDLAQILNIYNHAVLHTTATAATEPDTLEGRRAWFHSRTSCGLPVLAFERGGEILGWAALNPYDNKCGYRFTVDNSVYVRPDCQGQGIGKRLLSEIVKRARSGGFHSIVASIDATNQVSIRLHERFGFEHAALYRELYRKFDRWLDVVHMQLLL